MSTRGRVYNRIYNKAKWDKVLPENKEIMEDYLLELKQQQKKESTMKQYRNDLRIVMIIIMDKFKNKSVLELNRKHYRQLSLMLTDEYGLSNARVNRMLSATRSMLDYCVLEDLDYDEYNDNPAKKVKGLPKDPVRDIVFLEDEQILELRDALIKKKEYQKACLLMMAYDSIARRNELLQVTKESVLKKNITNEVVGKRGKTFKLMFFEGTREMLQLYLADRGEDDCNALWVVGKEGNRRPASYETLYDWFMDMFDLLNQMEKERLGENYEPILANPHSLRHSGIENLANGTHYHCKKIGKKFDMNVVKKHAHHDSVATTDSYRKNDSTDELADEFGIEI